MGQGPEPIHLTTDGLLKQRPVWSPDGKSLLFTRHQGATIFLYLLTPENKTERRLTANTYPEFDAVYSPDGKRIVTGSGDRTIKVWEAASEEQVAKSQEEERTAAAVEQAPANPR